MKIKYIMYTVQDSNVVYNNDVYPALIFITINTFLLLHPYDVISIDLGQ
jgi:hypothetical protein